MFAVLSEKMFFLFARRFVPFLCQTGAGKTYMNLILFHFELLVPSPVRFSQQNRRLKV